MKTNVKVFALVVALSISILSYSIVFADNATTTPDTATSTPDITVSTTTPDTTATSSTPDTTFSTTTTSTTATTTIATSTPVVATTTTPDTIHLTIRDGATVAFSNTVTLPDASSSNVSVSPTTGSAISIPARSLLAILESLETTISTFTISNLQYFTSYGGSFLINCITIPSATSTPLCYSWQDTINGTAPQVGIDHQLLNNNDNVFVYFGTPRMVTLSTTTVTIGQPFIATAESYNPNDNTFGSATGVTIGATQPNPSNPWSPLEIATSTVDTNGQAVFTLAATGTYDIGIKEDYYSPITPITVTDVPPPIVSTGGGGGFVHGQFNVSSALTYLASKQNIDGSYDTPMITDWAALAFATTDANDAKTKLRNYF